MADGVPVLKCQSLGPENHSICSSMCCSDVADGSGCRFAWRAWTPNLRWVWGHCQVGLIGRRADSCPQISQPENSRDSSVQAPLLPRGHLAMSGDHSSLRFTEECGRHTASREQRPERPHTGQNPRPSAIQPPHANSTDNGRLLDLRSMGSFQTLHQSCVSQIMSGSERRAE